MPWSSSPPSTPDSTASQDPPNSPFSPLFASFARLYGTPRPHISPLQNPDSDDPSLPVKPRRKLDKSMISSPSSASFSHLAHVVYDEEKGLVSSGVESALFDQESEERVPISEDIGRRRRLSYDSIRSRMSSPTSPRLFSQLASGSLYKNEKGPALEAKVASLTELDKMDRSSVPMPTSSPYRAFTRRDSSADEAPSYFDPFAGPEHPSHPHSVESRMVRPKSIDKSAISSPSPDSFLHVAHMGHNTAKGIASTGINHGSLAEIFTPPQSGTEVSGEVETGSNSPLVSESLPDVSTTEPPHLHVVTAERVVSGSSTANSSPPSPAPASSHATRSRRMSQPSPLPAPPPPSSPPSRSSPTPSPLPPPPRPANRPCPLRPMPDPLPPPTRIRLRPIPRPGVPVRHALRPLPRRGSVRGREGY